LPAEWFIMKDQGSKKGTGRKIEVTEAKPASGTGGKAPATRTTPVVLTSKEKIAANQKNKRRK
jgi:hypothetical protein